MSSTTSFLARLESKMDQQLGAQHVGYLLGAGASFLGGNGYPLAGQLWAYLAANIPDSERAEIQVKLDAGADGLEQALDLLDNGAPKEKPHRHLVTEAIAQHFRSIMPPTDIHQNFVQRLALRDELRVPVFCLNYDGLIELAADIEQVRVVDGFLGLERPFFDSQTFQENVALSHRGPRKPQADWRKGIVHLYKLHGSLGWFQLGGNEVRRLGLMETTPDGAKRLMVPPQHRKAVDTTAPPYAALWSEFRKLLCHGPNFLNRLVTIGYGFRDWHINTIIENALSRTNFTLLIIAHTLDTGVFEHWSPKRNVIIITDSQCALYGDIGPGHSELCKFENLVGRI